jgi:CBS domain-containing protein
VTTAKDLMTGGVRYVPATESIDRAAQLMRDHHVGALPVTDANGDVVGMVTDRDLVVKALAEGRDPGHTTVGALAERRPIAVEAETDLGDVLGVMGDAQVRRVPVLENGKLVGIISEANVVRRLDDADIAAFVRSIYVDR